MQFLFKTDYNDDIRFLAKTGEKVRVAIVVIFLLVAPFILQDYYLAELGLLLVYAIAGIGLMLLTGHTGQVSFGHAGFLGIGAYAHSVLLSHGVPFIISIAMAAVLSAVVGMALGRSASKMHGFYLAIATLAFGILIETVFGEWSSVTGGHMATMGVVIAADDALERVGLLDTRQGRPTATTGRWGSRHFRSDRRHNELRYCTTRCRTGSLYNDDAGAEQRHPAIDME